MRKSILFIAVALAALSTMQAFATGFNGRDLANAAQTAAVNRQNENMVRLLNATEVLRLQFAYDSKKTLEAQSPAVRNLFTSQFGEMSNKRLYQTSWFMAGAISKSGATANQTKLYNPLARIWLVIDWAQEANELKIANVTAMNAEVSDWAAAQTNYLQAFADAYSEALSTNRQSSASGDTLFAEADKWIKGLADWAFAANSANSVAKAQGQIHEGKCAQIAGDGALIDTMPIEVRASFAPITGFHNAVGGSVMFGSPLYPQIIIAADFDTASRPRLKNYTLLNLANIDGN